MNFSDNNILNHLTLPKLAKFYFVEKLLIKKLNIEQNYHHNRRFIRNWICLGRILRKERKQSLRIE